MREKLIAVDILFYHKDNLCTSPLQVTVYVSPMVSLVNRTGGLSYFLTDLLNSHSVFFSTVFLEIQHMEEKKKGP